MDAKITKLRLSRMLSYDWLKIVGTAAAVILVWVLIFTMSATRITPAQQFSVINYFGNVAITNTELADSLDKALKNNVFSYEVFETTTVDVPGSAEYGSTVLEARVSTSEGDVFLVPDIENTDASYAVNGETYYDSYLQTLVRGYGYALCDLDPESSDGYFARMETYLSVYYGENWENGALNEAKVEADFRARIAKNKDKRFKKAAEIEQGIQDEIVRIQKYRDGLKKFYAYVADGLVTFTKTAVYDHENKESLIYEGIYSINLCPDTVTMGDLKKVAAYTVESEDGTMKMTAQNMNVAFIVFSDMEPSFEYENLLYVNYLIEQYKTV